MSARRSYVTSTKHIVGCTLAIIGPALALAGVVAPPVGLALGVVLYMVGVSAVPAPKVHVVAGVDSREVRRSLRQLERRVLPRVPYRLQLKTTRITREISDLLPRVGALGAESPSQYVLVRCATDYLPAALEAYTELPRSYADHQVVADGKTPLALLTEQLDLLTKQIDRIEGELNNVHSERLIINGRFLEEKFGPAPLDLDGRADS